MNLTFIRFHHYENISSCYFHKQLLPENGKTCISCINIQNVNKVKVTTHKIHVLKSWRILDFHSEYYIPEFEKISFSFVTCLHPWTNHCAGKKHEMFVSGHNKFDQKCTHNHT